MNLVFMAKLGWRLLTKQNDLWAQLMHSKYIKGKVAPNKISKKKKSSKAWQGIVAASNLLKKGIKARVYNGKDSLFEGTRG